VKIGPPPHLVIDGFLPDATADRLFQSILASEANFTPSDIHKGPGFGPAPNQRASLRLPGRIGVDLSGFVAAIHDRFADLCAATGLAIFPIHHSECSIVAHRDGDFYRTHFDTRTGVQNKNHVRLLSCVYYLCREPKVFSGGELAIHGLAGSDATTIIPPQHNRLVAFPAFVPHEVLPISSASGQFGDARFSINCWLRRAIAPSADQ
jgi:SM-20-related protein